MDIGDHLPTTLTHGADQIRLKWHKLRLSPDDLPFSRHNLQRGLAAGASLEVDIQPLACASFVCLHDPVLEGETSGHGPVGRADAATISRLAMRGSDGVPPLLLDEIAALMRTTPPDDSALVQLDLRGEITAEAAAAFAAALRDLGRRFILSGDDWDAVTRLGGGVSGLALGYDPMEDLKAAPDGDVERLVRAVAPEADTIYLYRGLVRRSAERGDGLVSRLRARGQRVDAWTIDHGDEAARSDLEVAIAEGCSQITTNSPRAWAAQWRDETPELGSP